MDFSISSDFQQTLHRVRFFLEEWVYPLESRFLASGFAAVEEELNELRGEVRAMGLWLPQLPKAHGGAGLSLVEHGLVSAELGRSPLGHYVFNCQAPDAGNMEILIAHGTPEQRATYLTPVLEGRARSCFAMTEPDFPGSNPVWMGATARREGSQYVLDGRKWFCTGADGAAFAIVMAITSPAAPRHERASMFIVPMDTPGMRLVCNSPVMGERGSGWASHAELELQGCCVPESNRLGPEGAGFTIAQERLGPGRIHHCMRWMGICERCFDLLCARTAARETAPGVPLATQQIVQTWIAESRAEIDAARLLVLDTAWCIEREGAKTARARISLIKFHAARVLMDVLDRAIQAHGALGVTDYTPLAHFYRHERAARIYDGPDEVHKIAAAKRILKARTDRPA